MKLGGPAIHPGEILSDELAEVGIHFAQVPPMCCGQAI